MSLSRQKKEQLIQELHAKAERAKLTVFVNFRGLGVDEINKLRKSLRMQGIDFKMAKKTLLKRVLDGLGISGEMPGLEGELAAAFSYEESPEAAKIVGDFSKEYKGLKILGGIVNGKYVFSEFIDQLSLIPPREVLLANLLSVFSSPLRGFVTVMGGPMRTMVGVIKSLSNTKS